jgi:hypothetical protein
MILETKQRETCRKKHVDSVSGLAAEILVRMVRRLSTIW